MTFRHWIALVVLVVSILLLTTPALGVTTTDEVWVTSTNPGEPMADVIYVGEGNVELTVRWGQNYSFWSMEVRSPLFLWQPPMGDWEDVEAGHSHSHSLPLDPAAEPGTYDYTVYLNCTSAEGPVNRTFEFRTTLVEAWRVVDVHVPDGDDRRLEVTVETYVEFHNITVLFGGDGNVGAKDEWFLLEDVQPGETTFKTKVVKVPSDPGNAQEISWHLIGVVDNRTLELSEYNVNVDVSWGTPGLDGPLLMLALVGALLLARRRTGR